MQVRRLSVLVLFVGLAFLAKLGGIWVDWGVKADSEGFAPDELLGVSRTAGQVQVAAAPASGEAAPQEPAGAEPGGNAEGAEGETTVDEGDAADAADATVMERVSGDPFSLTDEEIELLQSLAERRRQLETRAMDMDQREILLEAAERRIDEKIVQLNQLQASIEALLEQHEAQEDAQLESLVRIYESMKPKDAARIFEQLDMAVLLQVIERMKERKTAPILAQMDPLRAKAITVELAQRRELPIPRE